MLQSLQRHVVDSLMKEKRMTDLSIVTDLPQQATDSPKFRGPLRYEMETSSSVLEAGKMFSVFLRITNPYDVPVSIGSVATELPVEFFQSGRRGRRNGTLSQLKRIFTSTLEQHTQRITARSMAVPMPESSPDLGVPAALDDGGHVDILQPGNSVLREFTLRTRQRTLFTPSVYCLHAQVAYQMEDRVNHDTVKTALNIKAPISALAMGAIPGAIAGSLLRHFKDGKVTADLSPDSLLSLAISTLAGMLIALVLVVAFARKKDAQPFLSVEDFYGGIFIGFLAGYNSYALLDAVSSTSS
jgi:hypothetical protein